MKMSYRHLCRNLFFAALLLGGCARRPVVLQAAAGAANPATGFVGRARCATCHETEDRLWQGSHHDLAMREATPATLKGDFSGRTLTHFGTTSTFYRRGDRAFVRTDGPDGRLHDYPVAYTFGVAPLQQYLVALPGGRYQALPQAWDARPAAEGGQRWFHLYPGEPLPAHDALHWTGRNQNWNQMCAECHSTGLEKRYLPERDEYRTTWSEIDVSCEGCHGPGARHLAWAAAPARARAADPSLGLAVRLRDPGRGTWGVDPRTGNGHRLAPPVATGEVETCARCHSRRTPIAPAYAYGRPLLDSHRPALLDEGLYHADGQIDGEVYEYGSFLQSRMFSKGVTCSDCHEPHSATLRRPGNALCTHCHDATRFDSPNHHHHAADTAGRVGAQCVSCHMPAKTYMEVDARRDHSLRIPRPDLSVELGTPNACNGCHRDRSPRWAAAAVARWTGGRALPPHWGEAIAAGRRGLPGAGAALLAVTEDRAVPAIARATAWALLGRRAESLPPAVLQAALERAGADPDPLVRLGATIALGEAAALAPEERLRLGAPRLADPVRGVRIEAARALAPLPPELRARRDGPAWTAALADFRAAQEANAERPEAHAELGWLAIQLGDLGDLDWAEAEYRTALSLDPAFATAWADLADLARARGKDDEAEPLLRQAVALAPKEGAIRCALGLLLIRRGRLDEATAELGQAAALAPGEPQYADLRDLAQEALNRARKGRGSAASPSVAPSANPQERR
jgi:predicted CXXCH cytochrome family protein